MTGEHPLVKAWIDGWMKIAKEKATVYREQGMSSEDADERAVLEVRMEIRRSPSFPDGFPHEGN
jgi:hypothetical protein